MPSGTIDPNAVRSLQPIQSTLVNKVEERSDQQWGQYGNNHEAIIPFRDSGRFYKIGESRDDQDSQNQSRENKREVTSHILIPKPYTAINHSLNENDHGQVGMC